MSINPQINYAQLGVRARRMLTLVFVEGQYSGGNVYVEGKTTPASESDTGIDETEYRVVTLAKYAAGEQSIGDENEENIPLNDDDRRAFAFALAEVARQNDDTMSFEGALAAMKAGNKVARAGWNGKGMWISIGEGNPALPAASFWNPHARAFAEACGGTAEVLPYILFKTADGKILMGWLASQSDMLADDWMVV